MHPKNWKSSTSSAGTDLKLDLQQWWWQQQLVGVTGLLGTFTDRPAKVTDCTVIFPAQSVCHHVQSGTPYLGQAGYLIHTGLFH